jgi:transposase
LPDPLREKVAGDSPPDQGSRRKARGYQFIDSLNPILCAGFIFPDMAFSVAALVRKRGFLVMAGLRRAIELAIGEEDLAALRAIARSRTEPARRVERARMVLAYREDPSFFAVGRALGVHHQTVERCVERALAYGPMAALDDRARPGKEPTITAEAKAWLVSLACRKAKDLGYPHELWTTRPLARHARKHGPAEGQASLGKLAQGTLCKILNEQEVKPHKVRTYLERRDPEFKQKMAEVLCVYREGKILKESAAQSKTEPSDAVAIVSYDEKPGIQAIATTAPDLPSKPGRYATLARDHELKASRHGQLAGRHRSSHRSSPRSRQGPPPRAANSSNSSSSSTPPIPAIRRSS